MGAVAVLVLFEEVVLMAEGKKLEYDAVSEVW
jgi:hypothetical protein